MNIDLECLTRDFIYEKESLKFKFYSVQEEKREGRLLVLYFLKKIGFSTNS